MNEEPTTELPELLPGIYRHYKGGLYQVLGYGHDANDETRAVVVYIPLQVSADQTGPRLAVRSVYGSEACFHDTVHLGDEQPCFANGGCRDSVPRFEWLGYELTAEMVTR